jgi:lipid-binding SYLF domain-containing protein
MKSFLTFILSFSIFAYAQPYQNLEKKDSFQKAQTKKPQPQVYYQEVVVTPRDILKTIQNFYDEYKSGQELLKKAEAYLVFPNVYRAGLVVGGTYAYGAMVKNNSIYSYYKMYSTSVGLQVGIQNYSLIIVFFTKESLKRFLTKEEWKVGLDTGLAFTSWKQGLDINSIDLTKDTVVIPFNNTGLMANISFEGTVFQRLNK